jgi:hypothetical protein
MTPTLRELGERVGAVPVPQLDAAALVAAGETQVRRRRLATVAAVTAAVVAVVLGALLAGPGTRETAPPAGPEPTTSAPDDRGSDAVETTAAHRLLTYAVGTTIHWGNRTVDVAEQAPGRNVRRLSLDYLDATDDGVVFVTGPSPRRESGEVVAPHGASTIWFTDGSAPVPIGVTSGSAVRGFGIASSAAGSTLAWVDPGTASRAGQLVVYDTGRMREVASFGAPDAVPLAVYDDVVYWSPAGSRCLPAGWGSLTGCHGSRHVMRFDTASGRQTRVSADDYDADRRSRPGLVTGPSGSARRGGLFLSFVPEGRRLFAAGVEPGARFTPTVALTGRPLRLLLPREDRNPSDHALTQWLDGDRVVLVEPESRDGTHLLVCRLSTGTCRLVARLPDAGYTEPGPAGIHG